MQPQVPMLTPQVSLTDAEVQDGTHCPKLKPTLASSIQDKRYERHSKGPQLLRAYPYPAPPGVPDFSEYGSRTLCTMAS